MRTRAPGLVVIRTDPLRVIFETRLELTETFDVGGLPVKTKPDASSTSGLAEAVQAVLPSLTRFLEFSEGDRAVAEQGHWREALNGSIPEQGIGRAATLARLAESVIPFGVRIGSPGFAGWVTTMPTIVPTVAALSASVAGAQRAWVSAFNHLEVVALDWLKALLGVPGSYQGVFSSGGSVANLVGLGAARQFACERLGIDGSRDGLSGLRQPRVYASNQVHHVVHRAAAVLGLGRRAVTELPTDATFSLNAAALRERLRQDRLNGCTPVAVVASAGTVNTGAIDPLREVARICRDEQVWLHIDGAYGAFGILDPVVMQRYDGFAEADSIAVDPHKWLAVPLGCGATFVRDGELLGRAFTMESAEYLEGSTRGRQALGSQFEELGYAFHHFGVEQSAQSRGVTVWAALLEIGLEGMRARVKRHNGFARQVAQATVSSATLELLAPVVLSICCFRYVPQALRGQSGQATLLNALNKEILRRLHHEQRHIPSSTELNGVLAIRPCFINPRTTPDDVTGLVESVERHGAQVWQEHQCGSRPLT